MSASEEKRGPNSGQPEAALEQPELVGRKGALSKISGAGVGSFIVWLADRLHWTDDWKLIAAAGAPWVAVTIAWLGPIVTDLVIYVGAYLRAQFFLRELDKLANGNPDDPVIKAKAQEVRQTIAELLADAANKSWSRINPSKRKRNEFVCGRRSRSIQPYG